MTRKINRSRKDPYLKHSTECLKDIEIVRGMVEENKKIIKDMLERIDELKKLRG